MIGVLGSGFGLYGHLPALVELGHRVLLPRRYQPRLQARAELSHCIDAVEYADDADDLLARVATAVLAQRPADNLATAYRVLEGGGPPGLVLEKPIAPSPQAGRTLLKALEAGGIRSAAPYLFLYTDWADRLSALHEGKIRVEWRFHSPQVSAASWKHDEVAGGGPLNYYFIHLIALAAHILGPDLVVEASRRPDEASGIVGLTARAGCLAFEASFAASTTESRFIVEVDGRSLYVADTPFGPIPRQGERDPRINPLKRFYAQSVFAIDAPSPVTIDEQTVALWSRLE